MTKREFLKLCGLLGITLPLYTSLSACRHKQNRSANFSGSVIIIGAGAAGMAAGYLLAQAGIEFKILEAAPIYGGRMKTTTDFTDFPIPLGAEWLHGTRKILQAIVNQPSTHITTQTQDYQPQDTVGYFAQGNLTSFALGNYSDRKFINTTWLGFFEDYLLPHIAPHLTMGVAIKHIDYQTDLVLLTDHQGRRYTANKVLVTTPLKLLQAGDITFMPPLPAGKTRAIGQATIWGGIKVFMEFTEAFYPSFLTFPDSETDQGQRLYYDAAYGQNTQAHILGLFAVGQQAKPYQRLSGDAQLAFILAELDTVFDGLATKYFVKHRVQNWNTEPFIRSAYLADVADSSIPPILARPVDNKIYFAGEAYTQGDDWGGVHNAAASARAAVEALVS